MLLQFSLATKVTKGVYVYPASFWYKTWTKRRWYFLLVALYYCKIRLYSRGLVQKRKFQNVLFWHWGGMRRLVLRGFSLAGPGMPA